MITVKQLKAKWRSDKWLSDGGARGAGRFMAKRKESGADFYFRYFTDDGAPRFWPIGSHDDTGRAGKTLADARQEAARLSALYRGGLHDIHGHFAGLQAVAERERLAAEAAVRLAEQTAKQATLRQLGDAYIKHLGGKQSAADVRRIFEKHVYLAAPDLAARRAATIEPDDFVSLAGQLVESGKGRTAAKLRSYLRAAYQLAIKSRLNPGAPSTLRSFGIQSNPLAAIDAMSKFNRTRERDLKAEEMGAFLRRFEDVPPGVKRDAIELFCLRLGGQRPIQGLRVGPDDVDVAAQTITIYDPKGKRSTPRKHVLPLTERASAIVQRRLDALADGGTFLFSSDGGITALRSETVSEVITDISAAMVKAKESRTPFQLRDLRRTAETMLASVSVSSDVRAQLQSHGLGGVQNRHYNQHDYTLEKRHALEVWEHHLDRLKANGKANVLPIKKKA